MARLPVADLKTKAPWQTPDGDNRLSQDRFPMARKMRPLLPDAGNSNHGWHLSAHCLRHHQGQLRTVPKCESK